MKRIHFPIFKETIFFRPIGVFTSLVVANSRVTLRDRAQIFLKKATVYEKDMTHLFRVFFVFSSRIKCE